MRVLPGIERLMHSFLVQRVMELPGSVPGSLVQQDKRFSFYSVPISWTNGVRQLFIHSTCDSESIIQVDCQEVFKQDTISALKDLAGLFVH